jgi:hypothetical protein
MVFSLERDIKVTKNHQNLLPTQSVLVAHTVLYTLANKLLLISQFSIRMIKTPYLILSENVNKRQILTFGLPRDVTHCLA